MDRINKPLWKLLERYVKDEPWKAETVFVLANQIKKLFKVMRGHRRK